MERYICIHGHFYQPPRENPWLEAIELQDSAYPYHDWNERITAECYAPNTASRILDGEGRIDQIVNNYAKISFNMGPTLLAWMEMAAPNVYQAILKADEESQRRFSGHGSALAQVYNHMILPLANRQDKHTQVLWGIRDFEHRFGRKPEGMWLSETAVDLESLEVLTEQGIAFTVLAPHQAVRTRPLGSALWNDVSKGSIDPTRAYTLRLPSGRSISLFFYDGPISRAVAFEGLLSQGETLAHRLMDGFSTDGDESQLVHIATDGETYGHHHRYGDMALAYALHHIESNSLARLTNYGEFLEKHPPTHEVEIAGNTSWSCVHGVERWRSNCGCNSGGHPRWSQEWRVPLREALDWLRDDLSPRYEEKARELLKDPWVARNDYIEVALNRSPETIQRFISNHAHRDLNAEETTTVLKLLELQRHAMLMYTSCGWFFDELSGIETVQVIQYAGRAVQLAQELFGDSTESQFVERLERAKSNIRTHQNGRIIYEKFVKPAILDWEKVGAHYAISSLFEQYGEHPHIYCYDADVEDYQRTKAGRAKLAVGRANFTSEVTRESRLLTFGVLHFGDHNMNGGVRDFQGEESYGMVVRDMQEAFKRANFLEVIRLMNVNFGESTYSLRHLFRDEQRKVLNQILESSLSGAEAVYQQLYENQELLMRFLVDQGLELPRAFQIAAEFFLNADLRRAMTSETLDTNKIDRLLQEASALKIELDGAGLGYLFAHTLEKLSSRFAESPHDVALLGQLNKGAQLIRSLPFGVELWEIQNLCYSLGQSTYPMFIDRARDGDTEAREWIALFASLAEALSVCVN